MKTFLKTFLTQIRAIDPQDGQMKTWAGPEIRAGCFASARDFCRQNMGYLEIIGEGEPAEPLALLGCPLCGGEWEGAALPARSRTACPGCGNMVEPDMIEL